jgi:hypothetical protein
MRSEQVTGSGCFGEENRSVRHHDIAEECLDGRNKNIPRNNDLSIPHQAAFSSSSGPCRVVTTTVCGMYVGCNQTQIYVRF